MQHRLIAGTINRYEPEDGWRNWHLDIADRAIWSAEINMAVAPEWVGDLGDHVFVTTTFREGMFDEVRAHHVLEHMNASQACQACHNAKWLLKEGGTFDVEVPNVILVTDAFGKGDLDLPGLQQWLYGEELPDHTPGDSHRQAYTAAILRGQLEKAGGFTDLEQVDAGYAVRFRAR